MGERAHPPPNDDADTPKLYAVSGIARDPAGGRIPRRGVIPPNREVIDGAGSGCPPMGEAIGRRPAQRLTSRRVALVLWSDPADRRGALIAREHLLGSAAKSNGAPRRPAQGILFAQGTSRIRSSTLVTPGADHAAATAASCSPHDVTTPDKITIPDASASTSSSCLANPALRR